jgi:putative iron-only hydrogenase system regulator
VKKKICIVGMLVNEKSHQAPDVQKVLSGYGTLILHRSGIPYSGCDRGLINLTLMATSEELNRLEKDLKKIEGLKVASLCLIDDAEELNVCKK